MLKFLLKKKCLDFTTSWKTLEAVMLGGTRMEEDSQPAIMLDSLLGEDVETARDELLGDDMKNYNIEL